MIITLIVTGLVILGIALAIVATKLGWRGEDLFIAGFCLFVVFGIILFAIGVYIFTERAFRQSVKHWFISSKMICIWVMLSGSLTVIS